MDQKVNNNNAAVAEKTAPILDSPNDAPTPAEAAEWMKLTNHVPSFEIFKVGQLVKETRDDGQCMHLVTDIWFQSPKIVLEKASQMTEEQILAGSIWNNESLWCYSFGDDAWIMETRQLDGKQKRLRSRWILFTTDEVKSLFGRMNLYQEAGGVFDGGYEWAVTGYTLTRVA